MRLLRRTVPLWVLLAVLTISASVVYATIQIYKDFQISMEIAGVYDMAILDTDGTTELSSINFGTLHGGDTKRYPASGHYYIYNLGDYHIWMSFDLTGFPSDVTFTLYF